MRRGMKLFGVASAVVLVLAAAGYSSTRGASPSGAVSARSATAVPAWLKKARKNALQAQKITTHVVSRAYGKFTPKPNATIFHIACNLAFEGCSKLANGTSCFNNGIQREAGCNHHQRHRHLGRRRSVRTCRTGRNHDRRVVYRQRPGCCGRGDGGCRRCLREAIAPARPMSSLRTVAARQT